MCGFWIDQVVAASAATFGCGLAAVLQFGFGIG
jgi:hypothetical protein